MKTIQHYSTSKDKLLHIETDLGIINIRVGLQDRIGQEVTSIEIIKDSENIKLDGCVNNRLIKEVK